MPAARSLKPALKLTVVACIVWLVYRTWVSPRPPRPAAAVLETPAKASGGRGVQWSKESDSGGAYLGVGEEVAGLRQQQLDRTRDDALESEPRRPPPPAPPPPRPVRKPKPHPLVEQVAKHVPDEVPHWVVAQEIDRVEGNGARVVAGAKPGSDAATEGTYKQELDAMKQRKVQKEFGKGNNREPATGNDETPSRTTPEDGEGGRDGQQKSDKTVYHLVDEDDELDAAQRGDSDARVALSGQRKKGPLIQVGGAGNAAGDKAAAVVGAAAGAAAGGAAADAVKAKGKDKWQGKGWDQRFKKVGGDKEKEDPSEGAAEGAADEDRGDKAAADPVDSDEKETANSDAGESANEKVLVQHPLVARFLQRDISHNGRGASSERSQVTFVTPDDEDAPTNRKPQAGNTYASDPTSPDRHNLTVCALVPNEQRFLPEWILYHSLLGVSRFALYDTTLPGAFGGEEIDQLADSMREEGGGGENAPTVEELKAQVAVSDSGREGLDEKGLIRRERVRGLEEWIDKGRVEMFYMKFKNPRASHDVHALMLDNCLEKFGSTSNWLAHLDVDEFLSLSTPLYGSDEPISTHSASTTTPADGPDHVYPLHDLLSSPALDSALCVPVPQLNYRNLGVRELKRSQGVLETQVHRDVLGEMKESSRSLRERGSLPQKTLIHTGFSSEPAVVFSGPHSCELLQTTADSDDGIRDSQGNVLATRDGLYHSQNLPIEPLAIAHFVQRDLLDCHSKLSSVADPLSLLPKGRGSVSCEAHYLPSASELASSTWRNDPANADLKSVPALGSVLEDRRMATSWAGRAAKTIGDAWRKSQERGMRRTSKGERDKLISRVKNKVEILSY
ncbi:hypothetical protein JCM11491_003316 [Sporobolomyces phaffii]